MTTTPKPSVLFVCVHNAGRSQMAAAFPKILTTEAVQESDVVITRIETLISELLPS